MYRRPPLTAEHRLPWLFRSPERAATAAYLFGALATGAGLGVPAASAEAAGRATADILGWPFFAWFLLFATLVPAVVWAGAVRLALGIRGGGGMGVVVMATIGTTLLSWVMLVVGSGEHGQSNMLQSGLALLVAAFLDLLRASSFYPVARLHERIASGESDAGPLHVAAAAWAWAAVWSLIAALVGPGPAFQLPAAIALLVSLAVLGRLYHASTPPLDDETLAEARARARGLLLGGFAQGAVVLAIGGGLFTAWRLTEQFSTTRDPAMVAIFRADRHSPYHVEPAGREGEIRLFWLRYDKLDHMVGWDERARVLLRGEALYQRVPRTRPAPEGSAVPAGR